jgi:CHAT domain-containing protein/Tfp pilus assembly protein PilF
MFRSKVLRWVCPCVLVSLGEVPAQRPFDQPCQLQRTFADDFTTDTLRDYEFTGDSRWENGQIILGENATLRKSIEADWWIELRMDLRFPEPLVNGQRSVLRIWLDLDDATDCFISFTQSRENDVTRSQIALVDTAGQWAECQQPQEVGHTNIVRGLANGSWVVRYRSGLFQVDGQVGGPVDGLPFHSFISNSDAPVKRIVWQCQQMEATLDAMAISRTPETNFATEQRTKLDHARQLNRKVVGLWQQGKSREALDFAKEALAIRVEILGEFHPATAASAFNLAAQHAALRQFDAAEALYQRARDSYRKILGEDHPDYAGSLNNLAMLYQSQDAYGLAEPLFRQAADIYERVVGRNHPLFADSLLQLAGILSTQGDFAQAERLLLRAKEIRERVLGTHHPDYAICLNNLGQLYEQMGAYELAVPLFSRAVEIQGQVRRENTEYATALNNLGVVYHAMGDYAQAERLHLQALEIREKVLGREHPFYANSLNCLARLYESMGDYAKAESFHVRNVELRGRAVGKRSSYYAGSLNNLAEFYRANGADARAEPLYREALAIVENALGREHPHYAMTLNNLGVLYLSSREFSKAEPLLVRAMEIRKNSVGAGHPDYASSVNNLAYLYELMGRYEDAERFYVRANQLDADSVGREHPSFANSLHNLSRLYRLMGANDRAEPLARQALEITYRGIELTAGNLSPRQHHAFTASLQYRLHEYISLGIFTQNWDDDVFRQVFAWKGSTLLRQRRYRDVTDAVGSSTVFQELQSVTAQLVHHYRQDTARPGWRERLNELADHRESLEKRLAARSSAYRDFQQSEKAEDLLGSIPPNVALVDFLEYTYTEPNPTLQGELQSERRLVAFVARHDAKVKMLNLGDAASIARAIDIWRVAVDDPAADIRALTEASKAASLLRERLWEPLKQYLEGIDSVVISPDGALGRFPFIALPSGKTGKYLLEDYRIAYVPVPKLIPQMLKTAPRPMDSATTLLLVGGVDYSAMPNPSSPLATPPLLADASLDRPVESVVRRGHDGPHFAPLPGTRLEIDAIQKQFAEAFTGGSVTTLTESGATERSFIAQLPAHTNLHIATHGFLQRPVTQKEVADSVESPSGMELHRDRSPPPVDNPDLLSGLVFAGANHEPDKADEDGILHSAEIAMLPMRHIDLVVLSACDTSLGTLIDARTGKPVTDSQSAVTGEGLIGVQRAFQVAGANVVIGSLWKVDDTATARLMTRFYDNLWRRRMSKLDALREAQIWMLRDPAATSGLPRGIVGVDPRPIKNLAEVNTQSSTADPRYWAAFVLSGDWR